VLCALPFSVTEASLPEGSILARRIPDAVTRLLRAGFGLRAAWATLIVDVDEGLGYAVCVGSADEIDPRAYLAGLDDGDHLLFGQIDLRPDRVWIDARLFSRGHDETILYPHFAGPRPAFLAALPEIAGEIAAAVGGAAPAPPPPPWGTTPTPAGPARDLLTADWGAFDAYCRALDFLTPGLNDPDEEHDALAQLSLALRRDPGFGLAARLGLEIAQSALGAESLEHSLDITDALARACPDLPEVALFHARLLDDIGRHDDARREVERARTAMRRRESAE
jgi:hypothetical protein